MLLSCLSIHVAAQKPFSEGTIVYQVKMGPDDPEMKPGIYTITIKGDQIRKEMKLSSLDYTIIINCTTNKVLSLQNRNGKKYAIELTMEDLLKDQEKFKVYTITNVKNENKKIAGLSAYSGNIVYHDGSRTLITYSKDWKPLQPVTYERFPAADFLPLEFFYKDESGLSVRFEAIKIEPVPVDNAVFRVPADYKIISHSEYLQMTR